jgi:hypothetical protein
MVCAARLCVVLFAVAILSGCASKDPVDYLPDCVAYASMNMRQIREEPGSKRLLELSDKFNATRSGASEKVQQVYFGLKDFSPGGGGVFGIILGTPGMAESLLDEFKTAGGAETKIDGKRAVKVEGRYIVVELTDSGLLFTDRESNFDVMKQTSKKKNPGAVNSPVFRKLSSLSALKPITVVANIQQLTARAAPQLGMLAMLNPKGAEALQQVALASLTANWQQQPRIELTAYLDNEESRKELAGLINLLMGQMKSQPALADKIPPMIQQLEAKSGPDGVVVALDVPKEEADKMIVEMEKLSATLPSDPKQREAALQGLLMQRFAGAAGRR